MNLAEHYRRELMIYLHAVDQAEEEGLFATCDAMLHYAANELIEEGLILEVKGPGCKDRAFKLTVLGKSTSPYRV